MDHSKRIDPRVLRWIEMIEGGEIRACKEQHQLMRMVRRCFDEEDIYTDNEQLGNYLGLAKYFPYSTVYEWEQFCLGLHLCTYKAADGRPRWPDLFLLGGRGLGKDGYIALESFVLTSPYNPIRSYDVDICANVEEQAMRPVLDILGVLENPRFTGKLLYYYRWTKEAVSGRQNGGVIKGRTSNPKSKDGMRSGMIVLNEVHQYENYANIKAYRTGLGKKPHPRELCATTNGDVREGPLDDMISRAEQVLEGSIPDDGMLPFICRLDDKSEADDPEMWVKANPTLVYNLDLFDEIKKEHRFWKQNPAANADFMTKRMNLPQSDAAIMVTDYSNIQATANIILPDSTKQPRVVPDLSGRSCVCGIDYAMLTDWASVNLRFWVDGLKYDINHSWLCLQSRDLSRIRADWPAWVETGLITTVDDVEISPDLLANWIYEQGQQYDIKKIALDNFRFALLASALKGVGFDAKERKNLVCLRPSDIMKIAPVVVSDFENKRLVWGDHPVLRWATNNTKLVRQVVKSGVDTGNFYFAKIEGKSRKTDPFMAMVASAAIESELDRPDYFYLDVPAVVW